MYLKLKLKEENNCVYLFDFGCAGSSSLHGIFRRRRECGLLSGCTGRASHCGGFSLQSTGSGVLGFQSLQLLGATAQASLGLCARV